MSKIHSYESDEIEVRYNLKRCIHAAECVRGLPRVFNPEARPWVQPGHASADEVARAVCTFDQRGCVSTQIVLFEGDAEEAASWVAALATELERLEAALPAGDRGAESYSQVHQLRGLAEIREAAGDGTTVRYLPGSSWTIVVTGLPEVVPVGHRTVWVVPCPSALARRSALESLGPVLQSVGMAGTLDQAEVALQAALAGASRVVPAAEIPFPRANWLHDGQRPLRELVRWAEWR